MTYLLPIFDYVARHHPERESVRAIIVYPMNALTNSQERALREYKERCPGAPVTFGAYTGQEDQATRQQRQQHPPHILLTNYMMLEYMLLRPAERPFVDRAVAELAFLVIDELHAYRGRQGADVAMLIRRLRERSGNPALLCIGTSATVASGKTPEDRKRAAAEVASRLFGVPVKPQHVVDETLVPAVKVPPPASPEALRRAVEAPLPPATVEGVTHDPLAAWVERRFGLEKQDGRWVRRRPITFGEGVRALAHESGLSEEVCRDKLEGLLLLACTVRLSTGEPVFAFRLHQFLAGSGTVYTTLEPPNRRLLTLEGQHYAPGTDTARLLYPLAFCRECGQEYYLVNYQANAGRLLPHTPYLGAWNDEDGEPGYLALDVDDLWSEQAVAHLPEDWFDPASGRLRDTYARHVPKRMRVMPDGTLLDGDASEGVSTWFQPRPFLLCLRCGTAYLPWERNDFPKLARLSQAGRSTATTLTSTSAVTALRRQGGVQPSAAKVLSFTDNRQDASLQAGHFNDFVQVAIVRAGLYRALERHRELDHATVAPAVVEALRLDPAVYARQAQTPGPGQLRAEQAFRELVEYRLYEDLRGRWRVAQPNLEQCGLLVVDFVGLQAFCENHARWAVHPVLEGASPQARYTAVRAFLDHLRRALAIHTRVLRPEEQAHIERRVKENLAEPWAPDEREHLEPGRVFLLPGFSPKFPWESSLGPTSLAGRYLRRGSTWGTGDIEAREYPALLEALIQVLQGHYLIMGRTRWGAPTLQLAASALVWRLGSGDPPPPNPIRARAMRWVDLQARQRLANRFFAELYQRWAQELVGVEGREHTAAVRDELRRLREKAFSDGVLSALFCSPTMELGIDIHDLHIVHLRNLPPTPANYAQRSGRAGRGGQPALVLAFAGEGSAHDQYYFRRRDEMIAGSVVPARFDLANEALLRAHLHSLFLAATGLSLGESVGQVLSLDKPGYPLRPEVEARLHLPEPALQALTGEARRIVEAAGPEVKQSAWWRDDWVEQVIAEAPARFEAAFDRWRHLYADALRIRDEARRRIDRPHASRQEIEQARRREQEALRQIDLLLHRVDPHTEGDFYPYRYLAAEGYIPGYNFPRLPVRALVSSPVRSSDSPRMDVVERPRFLAVSEFGPRNRLYYEGHKHVIDRLVIPPGGVQARLAQAKVCQACGYLHDGEALQSDTCQHCGKALDATGEFLTHLLEMSTVKARRSERITCDEEERLREGYRISTQYRFAPGPDGRPLLHKAVVESPAGEPLLRLTHAPQSTLWRINHGWRRSSDTGFALDAGTGEWIRRPDEVDDEENHRAPRAVISGIRLYVVDVRNIVLIHLAAEMPSSIRESMLLTLGYALQRAIQVVYQVEEQEVAVELVGKDDGLRLLLWEAAEGGTGIGARLFEEPGAFGELARVALELLHFEGEAAEDRAAERCARACYDCLLSYANQPYHGRLDRHRVRPFLMSLRSARTVAEASERSYDEQYRWLLGQCDPASEIERRLLEHLYRTGRRLPDAAQTLPEPDVAARPDFLYRRAAGLKGACVFCHGSVHREPAQQQRDRQVKDELEDRGYRVIEVWYDRDLEAQIRVHEDVFGRGVERVGEPITW